LKFKYVPCYDIAAAAAAAAADDDDADADDADDVTSPLLKYLYTVPDYKITLIQTQSATIRVCIKAMIFMCMNFVSYNPSPSSFCFLR
jgi:hypothetical protein